MITSSHFLICWDWNRLGKNDMEAGMPVVGICRTPAQCTLALSCFRHENNLFGYFAVICLGILLACSKLFQCVLSYWFMCQSDIVEAWVPALLSLQNTFRFSMRQQKKKTQNFRLGYVSSMDNCFFSTDTAKAVFAQYLCMMFWLCANGINPSLVYLFCPVLIRFLWSMDCTLFCMFVGFASHCFVSVSHCFRYCICFLILF